MRRFEPLAPLLLALSLTLTPLVGMTAHAEALSRADVTAIITDRANAWGVDPAEMIAVASCESHLDPDAVGDHGDSVGLFQINANGLADEFWAEGYSSRYNAWESADFAAEQFSRGNAGAWSCTYLVDGATPPWWGS